jgi:hypothetical protein
MGKNALKDDFTKDANCCGQLSLKNTVFSAESNILTEVGINSLESLENRLITSPSYRRRCGQDTHDDDESTRECQRPVSVLPFFRPSVRNFTLGEFTASMVSCASLRDAGTDCEVSLSVPLEFLFLGVEQNGEELCDDVSGIAQIHHSSLGIGCAVISTTTPETARLQLTMVAHVMEEVLAVNSTELRSFINAGTSSDSKLVAPFRSDDRPDSERIVVTLFEPTGTGSRRSAETVSNYLGYLASIEALDIINFLDKSFSVHNPRSRAVQVLIPFERVWLPREAATVWDRQQTKYLRNDFLSLLSDLGGKGEFEFLAYDAAFVSVWMIDAAQNAMVYSLGGFVFVLVYFRLHCGSTTVALFAYLQILLAVPMQFFAYRFIFQQKYIGVLHVLAVYFTIGIGADDTFIFFDAWQQSLQCGREVRATKESRMRYAWRRATSAMFMTSVTDCLAFLATFQSAIVPIKTSVVEGNALYVYRVGVLPCLPSTSFRAFFFSSLFLCFFLLLSLFSSFLLFVFSYFLLFFFPFILLFFLLFFLPSFVSSFLLFFPSFLGWGVGSCCVVCWRLTLRVHLSPFISSFFLPYLDLDFSWPWASYLIFSSQCSFSHRPSHTSLLKKWSPAAGSSYCTDISY